MKIYTNGAYDIDGRLWGLWRWRRVRGVIVKSKYPRNHPVGEAVDFPLYHTFKSKEPQFRRKRMEANHET